MPSFPSNKTCGVGPEPLRPIFKTSYLMLFEFLFRELSNFFEMDFSNGTWNAAIKESPNISTTNKLRVIDNDNNNRFGNNFLIFCMLFTIPHVFRVVGPCNQKFIYN